MTSLCNSKGPNPLLRKYQPKSRSTFHFPSITKTNVKIQFCVVQKKMGNVSEFSCWRERDVYWNVDREKAYTTIVKENQPATPFKESTCTRTRFHSHF
jgi:hypothetical protein